MGVLVGRQAPDFTAAAVLGNGEIVEKSWVETTANLVERVPLVAGDASFEWVSQTTANEFYNQLAIEVGIEADAFSELDPKAPLHHSYSSGHCLCAPTLSGQTGKRLRHPSVSSQTFLCW